MKETDRIVSKINAVMSEELSQSGTSDLEQLGEDTIMRALQSNFFSNKDIVRLYEAVKLLEKPVPGILITLYELQGQYEEAFKLHLSSAELRDEKRIFSWIDKSLG